MESIRYEKSVSSNLIVSLNDNWMVWLRWKKRSSVLKNGRPRMEGGWMKWWRGYWVGIKATGTGTGTGYWYGDLAFKNNTYKWEFEEKLRKLYFRHRRKVALLIQNLFRVFAKISLFPTSHYTPFFTTTPVFLLSHLPRLVANTYEPCPWGTPDVHLSNRQEIILRQKLTSMIAGPAM